MKNWIKKHPIKTALLAIFTAVFVLPASLNYSGFCIAEGRWLSDAEKIRLAVEAIRHDPNLNYLRSERGDELADTLHQSYKYIPYPSVEDFMAKNPNCCKVLGVDGGHPMWPSSLEDRLSGFRTNVIEIKYNARFRDNAEKPFELKDYAEYPFISNCGHVFTNFPSNRL